MYHSKKIDYHLNSDHKCHLWEDCTYRPPPGAKVALVLLKASNNFVFFGSRAAQFFIYRRQLSFRVVNNMHKTLMHTVFALYQFQGLGKMRNWY